jgi:hypothetical protein
MHGTGFCGHSKMLTSHKQVPVYPSESVRRFFGALQEKRSNGGVNDSDALDVSASGQKIVQQYHRDVWRSDTIIKQCTTVVQPPLFPQQ